MSNDGIESKTKPVTSYEEAWEEIHGPGGFYRKPMLGLKKTFNKVTIPALDRW